MKTGKLEKIDTREVWPREDEDFTPWLAKEGDRLFILPL